LGQEFGTPNILSGSAARPSLKRTCSRHLGWHHLGRVCHRPIMANAFARFILFLNSYIPPWVIFAIITPHTLPKVSMGFSVLTLASFARTVIFLSLVQGFGGIEMPVGVVRRKDSDTMSYIASYIIPFAATAFDKTEQVVALGVFLVVLCAVYINSSMIHINPLLSLMGYNLYEIEDADGNPYFLISKRSLRRGDAVKAIDLANSIFLEKRA
jgi:hypothetical protein